MESPGETQRCLLASSARTLLDMGAFEPSLEELLIGVETSREIIANSAWFDCVGFKGLCVDCLTEEEYLAEKRRHSWICQGKHECQG